MTITVMTPGAVSRPTSSARRDRTLLLMLPSLAMLIFLFLVPLALFFVRTFAEFDGTTAEFIEQARDLLLSQAFLTALGTTNWISLIVTVTVLLIGYPIAYYLTTATGVGVRIVVLSIVLPYFTSIIVRTFSWMVLLGEHGLVNDVLLATGLIHGPLPLMYNRLGVLIGMSYVLLPYMVLTLYAAMLSIGFFITPALMGGQHDIMIAMLIDRALEVAVDWPSAALMSLTLLLVTLALYAVYYRITDINRLIGAR